MATGSEPCAVQESEQIPRRWLRGRWLALAVALGPIALACITIWRMRSLDDLPDVEDPFDVAEVRRPIDIPDSDNAFVAYAAASQLLVNPPNPADEDRYCLIANAVADVEIKPLTWASATSGIRSYLDAKRAALDLWREGSGRRDALYYQPDRISPGSVINLIPDARVFAGLAALEGSRLETDGAWDEAWTWYLAMLRCSRLIGRHGLLVQRQFGGRIHALAAQCILGWAAQPRLGVESLRRAVHETLEADALTPPVSEAIKLDYVCCLGTLENLTQFEGTMRDFSRPLSMFGGKQSSPLDELVPWPVRQSVHRVRLHANNELERIRRVFRLLFANWLAQVDRPAAERAPLAVRTPIWIYAIDPTAPLAARAVRPEFLAQALDGLEISFLWGPSPEPSDPPWDGNGELVRERRRRSALIVRLAAELYRREHGIAPKTAGDLLGQELKQLPEGITAEDPIPAGLE
jgi:hypothetical protein